MTTATALAPVTLYHSPRGLYPFQAQGVAVCYSRPNNLAVWSTGIGKTHLAMATSAMLFEDGEIDLVLLVCEKNKLAEWMRDWEDFTDLTATLYAGTPAKRAKIRESLDSNTHILVGTYETFRIDLARQVKVKQGRRQVKRWVPYVLLEAVRDKRVLIVWDEMTKLGNRGSQNHKAHALAAQTLDCRLLGLTATPVERSPENLYNLGRILTPHTAGSVESFNRAHVVSRDLWGNPTRFKGLDLLAEKLAPVMLRKRKEDPDVIDQFPRQVEEVTYVDLGQRHREFYEAVLDTFEDAPEIEQKVLFTVARQIADHPLSMLRSNSRIARVVCEQVGAEGLAALGSAKLDALLAYLDMLVKGQGAQVVVFTFFGQSVLPLVHEALEEAGYAVAVNHGGLTARQRDMAQTSFRAGEVEVFLTSDAGSRGINLPEASYVCNFELPLTYANYTQRINRIHRIDSPHASVTAMSFIARYTIDDAVADLVLKRNRWSDKLLGDEDAGEDFLSARDRRTLLKAGRKPS